MTAEQVKLVTKALHGTGERIRPLKITLDNMFVVDEQKDIVLWDDTNDLFIVICSVDEYQRQTTTPVVVKVFGYEQIQKIEVFYDIPTLTTMMTDVNTLSPDLISTELGNKMINYFSNLYKPKNL